MSGKSALPFTEKSLMGMGGWEVFRQARGIRDAGLVEIAEFSGQTLRGRVRAGGKPVAAGLKFHTATDVENLCGCRDARVRALICAHSVALGLELLSPKRETTPERAERQRHDASSEKTDPRTPTMESPRVSLELEGSLRNLEARISFAYDRPGTVNQAAESNALAALEAAGFDFQNGRGLLSGEPSVARFFASRLPRLRKLWNVTIGERFGRLTEPFLPVEPRFALKERTDGWLDFHIHFVAGQSALFAADDLQRLLAGGDPRISLSGGKTAIADDTLLADLEEVLRDCEPQREGKTLRVPAHQAPYLKACIADWQGREESPSPDNASPADLGQARKILRPYQLDGALWLHARAKSGGFGLLADEMGLGKTIQTLAALETLPGPHLIVCPSSLVWNWVSEAKRFTPGLRVSAIEGSNREGKIHAADHADLVVTSYALLRRDADHYENLAFGAAVLDEAQHIKNPESQNARAARTIKARARFILTGTPLENSVRDLWSLFAFLSPGLLGQAGDFRERYEKPIAEGGSSKAAVWPRLVRRVRPHMLRRTKAEVLPDLPPKTEQILEVDLSPAQKAAYTQLQIAAREQIDAFSKTGGGAARARALAALLRLRQACCDLRLLGAEASAPESAKLEALREILAEAADGGHKVLVFSQFTSMLDLVGEALDEDGMAFARLDGSTKDRAGEVQRFQEDSSLTAFLISLKAGGVGLTLTAADTVVLFDPWWNPAAEAQATDRAHRIGQTRAVTAIRLVARDTVEQRVVDLQADKRELLAGLLDPETAGTAGTAVDASTLAGLVV